jgi:membrane protease YdiL (CAAX protease family)
MSTARRDALALGFASLFPLAMAWCYFVVLGGEPERYGPWVGRAYAIGKLIQFPFPLLYVVLIDRGWRPRFRWHWDGFAFALAFAALVDLGMAGLYFGVLRGTPLLAGTPEQIFAKLRGFAADTPATYVALGLFIAIVHSGLEEYYWRWFVFGWMRRYLSLGSAAVLSGLAFMLHHVVILAVYFPGRFWTLALPFSLCVAVGGIVWAWLYERTGTLLAPWLSHALVDAAILFIGYDLVRGLW